MAQRLAFTLSLFLPALVLADPAPRVELLERVHSDGGFETRPLPLNRTTDGLLRHEAELGVRLSDLVVRTNLPPRGLEVEQYEVTRATVSDEGPHVDLLAWKSAATPARVLKGAECPGCYQLLEPPSEPLPFPSYTPNELEAELRRVRPDGVERWIGVAQKTGARVSVAEVRVTVKRGKRVVATLSVMLPLGC